MSVSSQREKGERRTIYTCAQSHSPSPCLLDGEKWGGELGRIGLRNVHIWGAAPSSPFPQPNCAVKWAKSTAGESFAFIENYSELTLCRRRICKWAKLTRIGLDRAFWSSYLEYLKEGGGEAAVRQGAYFTKLVQCLKGEEKRFILIPSCRNSLNDSLFQNWYKVAFFL